jgi:hypothetical protein
MNERRLGLIVIVVAVFAAVVAVNTDSREQTLTFSISNGVLVSAFFYLLVVWIPTKFRRDRILRNLGRQYRDFKLACIQLLLMASDSQTYGPREMLLDQSEFRRYFKIKTKPGQTRWDMAANEMQRNSFYTDEIRYELETFREEIQYVLTIIDIEDEEVFIFMKRLTQVIQQVKTVRADSDDLKSLFRFLWEVFTGWSFVDGYRENDIIEEMIVKAR